MVIAVQYRMNIVQDKLIDRKMIASLRAQVISDIRWLYYSSRRSCRVGSSSSHC